MIHGILSFNLLFMMVFVFPESKQPTAFNLYIGYCTVHANCFPAIIKLANWRTFEKPVLTAFIDTDREERHILLQLKGLLYCRVHHLMQLAFFFLSHSSFKKI